jgi:archaellum component FlaC
MNEEIILYLKKIDSRLENIENDISDIKTQLNNNLSKDCKKMSDHIDFIERVYDNVKNPLGYLCSKLNFYSNNNNYTLENIDSTRSDT